MDTVIKDHDQFIDNKCALLSEIKADNPYCLVKKNKIISIPSNVSSSRKVSDQISLLL